MSRKVHPIIEQISVHMHHDVFVEAYLIRGARNILIDTGIVPALDRDIKPALDAFGLTVEDIHLILNTHGHPDHAGGDGHLKAAGGAEVCIHREDEPFLNDRVRIFELYSAPVMAAMGRDVSAEKEAFLAACGPEVVPDRHLQDGDLVDGGPGLKLRVIHVPGHSLGSVAFFWEEEGVAFSGDAVSGLHLGDGKLPIILDLISYQKSLRRLGEMPIGLLLSGHRYRGIHSAGSSVRKGEEVMPFFQDSLEFAERIEAAIGNVSERRRDKGFPELVDLVIGQLPARMGFKPIREIENPMLTTQSIYFRLHGFSL